MRFLLLVAACAYCPVVFVVALLVSVEYVRGQFLCFSEIIILGSLSKGKRRIADGLGSPLPLADVVTFSNGSLEGRECGNVTCGQGLTEVGVNRKGLEQIAVHIIEVYGVQILLVVYCIVGEVIGGEYQRTCILGDNGLLNDAVLAYVVNVAVELSRIILERNGDGSLTAVKCGTNDVKAVNCRIVIEAYRSGPLGLFTDHARDCEGDIVSGCIRLDVVQCLVIKKHGHGVSTIAVACCNNLKSYLAVQSSKIKDNCRDKVGNSPTVAVEHVAAQREYVCGGAFLTGNVAAFTKVRLCAVLCIIICVSSCLGHSSTVCCVPACKGVGVIQIHALCGSCGSCGHGVVLDFNRANENALCIEVDRCIQLSLVGGVSGCGNDCFIPTLEGQNVCNCFDPGSLGCGSCTVRYFDGVCLIGNDEGYVSGVLCYVGSVTGNCRQLKAVACPTLEVQGIEEVQIFIQRRNSTVCEGLGVESTEHVKGDRVLIYNLLDSDYAVRCGHGGLYVTVLIHSYQRIANALELGVVRSKLCAVRQEAFKNRVALFIYELNGVQISKGNAEENIGCDVTGGNVIAQGHGSAVSGDGDLIQHVLEPCTGVIGYVKCKAEGTVALVGIGQFCILQPCGNLVVEIVNQTGCGIVYLLCLCRLGNSVLVISKLFNHALYDCLRLGLADAELVCNTCSCCIKLCAANECVCILELGQSNQIVVSYKLGKLIYKLNSKGSVFALNCAGSLVNQNIGIVAKQVQNGTGLTDSVVSLINHADCIIVSLLCASRLGNAVLEVGKYNNHTLHNCLCLRLADAKLACNACSCRIKLCAANECVCILELSQLCKFLVADGLDQIVNGLGGHTVNRLGSLFRKDLTVCTEQIVRSTCTLYLIEKCKILVVNSLKAVKDVVDYVHKLLVLEQIEQIHQLTNGCAAAQACNDGLLGLIGYARMIKSLGQYLRECAGNEDFNTQVTAGCNRIIDHLEDSLCAIADQTNIALESNVELYVVILLAVCTQRDIVSADDAVITHIGNVVGRDQIGQQRVLDAGGGNDLTVVA